ncbi:VWA domain-containing protein [Cellulomonas sp. Sa3CUA2]|uniref:VWA domain-containing protein n=1 Tax=Cellulomonas avistercoris TaxID=2762242 RepID=A0ABR8Q9Q4_9CELL|nr:VWA domain-containing protein [Cellulomonas avistercoris]MBD7917157.1 VWA domain-containing protein [Cellulomonas avistercoris]
MENGSRRLRRIGAVLGSVVLLLSLTGVTTAQGSGPGVAPMAVPTPTGNDAVITVRVGGDRVGTTGVTGLAGVTLRLYDGTTSPTTPVAADWATCVSDADGDCSFVVPDTQTGLRSCTFLAGANCDRRFWVVQTGVPEGFTQNSVLRTGSGNGTGSELTAYQFRTGEFLRAGNTYTSQSDFMVGTGGTNRSASGGTWQQSRVNPAPLQQCGLNVALVLDLSGSVTPSQLVDLKAAADTFVDSLVGTPSQMALFSFSSVTPASGATRNYPGLTEVSTQAGADTFKSRYESWTSGGGTNWDRGLAAAAEAAGTYDLTVVITDGDPTYYSQPAQGPGNYTRLREMENGIFSANELKAEGSRVLAVGVGAGVADAATARNLAAISGPTAYDGTNPLTADYYQVADYAIVGQALRQLALGECAGSLSVVKQLVGPEGDVASATPGGAGWTFDASTATAGVSLETTTATTDTTSAVSFPLTYEGGVTSGTVEIQEEPRTGTTLFPVGGANAVCTDLDTGETLTVTNAGDVGFTVDVASTEAVSCIVYNQEAASASVTVDKEWVVNGAAPVAQGNQPSGLTSQLTLTGPQGAGPTPQDWHVTRTGYVSGDSVTFNEEITLVAPDVDPDLCEVAAAQVVAVDGQPVTPADLPETGYQATLHDGDNTYTVRNTIECESRLTLAKSVEGSADPGLWTLSALPAPDEPAGQLPGPSGQAGTAVVTDQVVTPDVAYQLAESGGTPTYVQDDQRSDLESFPSSTGSWNCIRIAADGTQVPGFADGLNGGVVVPLATRVSCTATNRTAQLVLAKEVVNDDGGTAVAADFTLRAVPSGTPPVEGLPDVEVPGASVADAQLNEVRPDYTYTLSETGPEGYRLTEISCTVDGTSEVVTEITVGAGQSVLCVFTNADDPAQLTLRKVVDAGSTGATQTPADWTLTATPQQIAGQDPVSGNGADGVTGVEVLPGGYALSESAVPGFAAGTWTCTTADGTTVPVSDDVVTLANGADVTCSITNTAQQPTLTLVKQVVNDAGGTATVADWTLTADGPTAGVTGVTGDAAVTDAPVAVGSYALSEAGPAGYAAGDWACATDETAVPVTDGAVAVGVGQDVTCTIVNEDSPALLTLRKVVDAGATGATQTPANWTLTATPQGIEGQDPVSGDGADGVTAVEVFAGGYALSESVVAGFAAGDWSCATADGTAVTVADDVVTLANGADVTCTITNTAQPSTLTLVKQVVNDNGGTAAATDWTLTATGPTTGVTGVTGDPAVTGAQVAVGSYALTEAGPAGYTAGAWECAADDTEVPVADGAVTVALGQDVTCTIVNDDQPALLTLRKVVDAGTTGATQTPADWTLTATPQGITGQDPVSGDGADGVTAVEVFAGGYALTESTVAGFTAGTWTCATADGTPVTVTAGVVDLANGTDVTCTITNTAQQSTLTLVKQVVNDDGGTAAVTDWTLTAAGPTAGVTGVTGDAAVTDAPVAVGDYTLTEAGPAGYTAGDWACATDEAALPVSGGVVTIGVGQDATCTIVNDDQPGTLTLVKEVVNDQGGTAEATDWTLTADGPTPLSGASGSTQVTGVDVDAGDYALSETGGPAGYAAGAWSCEGGTLTGSTVTVPNGGAVTCTIVNDDQAALLTLRKVVDAGATGATQTPADWTLTATPQGIEGQDPVSGDGADGVTAVEVFAGGYGLTESTVPGFTAGAWSCATADGTTVPVADDAVTLANGADVTCSITNTAQQPTLTLVKQVVNAAGGTAVATDWTLTATGPTAGVTGVTGAPAVTDVPVAIGGYTLSEAGPAGYLAGDWVCATDETTVPVTDDVVTVALGQDVTCTIVNEDSPAVLTLRKVVDAGTTGATQTPADWTLTATPQGIEGQDPVSGDGEDGVTGVEVFAGGYALSESTVAGFAAGDWSCATADGTAVTVTDDVVTLANGADVTCTITNTAQQSTLTLVKQVVNDDGGTAAATDWTLTASGPTAGVTGTTGDPAVTGAAVAVGDYTLSESALAGYEGGSWACEAAGSSVPVTDGVVTVGLDQDVTCTIVNDDLPGLLTLIKVVVNEYGGTADASQWTLRADGPTPVSGATRTTQVTDVPVSAGAYALSELGGPAGYVGEPWTCAGGELTGSTVTIANGAVVRCTIVNDDTPALLTLRKVVDAGTTGATQTPADWTLTATPQGIEGQDPVSGDGAEGVTQEAVFAGGYALSESTVAGFAAGDWSCATADGTAVTVADDVVTLANGADVTCTITNTAEQSTLTLVKEVVNAAGGTAVATDWTLTAAGPTAGVTGVTGAPAVTDVPVAIGGYTLSEAGPAGYLAGDWVCATDEATVPVADDVVTVALGQDVTCTIVNEDSPAVLTLRKVVDAGATGATQTPADWTLTATPQGIEGQDPVSGDGEDGVTGVEVFAGGYALSESTVAGFAAGDWSCMTADGTAVAVTDDVVTLANGADVTCTITNTAQQPTLTLVKQVVNDNGGTAAATDWTLTASGPTTGVTGVTGDPAVTGAPVAVGDYTLSETGLGGYAGGPYECEAGGASVPVTDGVVTVGLDQDVTCTVVNDDQPATLTLVKRVVNDHGGTAEPGEWTLTADGPTALTGPSGSTDVTGVQVDAGDYALSEDDGPGGYTAGGWTCEGGTLTGDTVAVSNGDDVTCTVVNTFDAPRLTLVKVVVNEEGGTAVPEDWTLRADGPESVNGATRTETVTEVPVAPGRYTLSEADGPEGYSSEGWVCEDAGGPVPVEGDVVELAVGDVTTCTVTNTDRSAPATFTVVKDSDPPRGEQVGPGQTITYTVVATVLTGDAVDIEPIVDDLSGVLGSAVLDEGSITASTGTATPSGTSLTWDVGTLVGVQTLTYRVRVADDVNGEALTNVVTAPGAEPCVEPPADVAPAVLADATAADVVLVAAPITTLAVADEEECRTTTHPTPTRPVPPPQRDTSGGGWLAVTGGSDLGLGAAALALLAVGGALVVGARQRAGAGRKVRVPRG